MFYSNNWQNSLFNKLDLFKAKLERTDLSEKYPDYHGGKDVDAACKYFESKFLLKNVHEDKRITTYFMSAIDTDSMKTIFEEIMKNVIENKSEPVRTK